MEILLIISIVSIIFASISLIFTFIRFGFSVSLEFAERNDIRELKNNMEESLRNQLKNEISSLMERYQNVEDLGPDDIREFIIYGRRAYVCQLPTMIISRISEITSNLIQCFVLLIIGIIGFILSIWLSSIGQFLISKDIQNLFVFFLFVFGTLLVADNINNIRKIVPGIIKLRRSLLSFSDDITLDTAEGIEKELKDKKLI